MGHAFFIVALSLAALASLVCPWIGVVCAYLLVVLDPQAIWFWDFAGLRPALWVLIPTGVGIVFGLLRGIFDPRILFTRRNLFILVLWVCLVLSYYFGPYTQVQGPWRFDDPDLVFSIVNKMMLLYFMASLCIDTELKVKTLFLVVCGSAVYLIYWGNLQYFSGKLMGQRLAGPTQLQGGGLYHDENDFAMLFVVAQPFLWYLGFAFKKVIWRWTWWLIIPFCWHAVFLTASRGGLVGLAVTILLIAFRSKYRMLGLALVPAFVFVYIWQGGGLMKSRASTIVHFQHESSAETRIQSWRAASHMIAAHPLIGVGLASYGPAFPDYSKDHPREAHDTLLQITAESGITAGLMYVLIVLSCIRSLWRTANGLKKQNMGQRENFLYLMNEATLTSFCGLVTCSLFLSLQIFEIFYCLNVLANGILYVARKSKIVPSPSPQLPIVTPSVAAPSV
ncbi:MAG TPA: O-antigen ligase family protein [Steroidobacteraceae bacterium]|nr:O-antigen ligase family protein [Steroidobacteraceae bacterium]